jgi:DHA2 family multidrug resistance protein
MAIPLTQLAVSGLPPRDIPQGVALNNMMRQVGGSFGIASINTYLDHRTAVHRLDLVSRLTLGHPATEARLNQIARGMIAHGVSSWEAPRRALAALEFAIERQSSLLSYLDAYHLVALICIGCLPLIFFAGRPRPIPKAAAVAAAESH